jgi:glycosyltransferase involved in cell wall biosynthesis
MTIVKRKLFFIITPVFNSAGKIAATVQSVRNQDASLLEYHIVDGGSADATLDVVRSQAPEADLQYVDEVVADYEGGGISDTGYDRAFQSDLPDLIRRSFGVRCLLILWWHRTTRRLLGIRLAIQARVRRMAGESS